MHSSSPTSNKDDDELLGQVEVYMLDGEELQFVEQIHTTGYWVNEHGRKVSGKLRFRIKNFDVGLAGDYGYLSIEGTFLDQDAERALSAQEREMERARRAKQNPSGLLRPLSRRVPEFSMTKFGREDEEEDDGQRTVLYKGSRPGTPDD
jgi:DNA-directed RNA polymerase I subunit RPA43